MSNQTTIQVLKIPSFRFFLATRLFLTLALQMQAVIIGWQIYKLTNDPFSLGLVGLAEAIPAISIALYAGHMADIHNRKTILLISLLAMIVSSCGLFFAFGGPLVGKIQLYAIYSFICLSGFARGFYAPASFATISQLVPRNLLTYAGTLNSTIWQFASVIGPALGGFCYAYLGLETSFTSIIILSCIAFFALNQIQITFEKKPPTNEKILSRLKVGISFVYNHKIILSALSLDLFSVLFGGATALLPIFANEILHTGAEGLGLLRAAPSFGAVLMMTYLSMRKNLSEPGKTLILAVGAFGLCMLGFGLSQNFILSLILLFLSGAFDSISVVVRSNILQIHTPDDMRGRVSAVNTIFIGSSNEIGAFESGLAAKLIGTANSVIFGGLMTLGIVAFTNSKAKELKELRFQND
ncbi:MAG: MFS transporter [Bacteroidetes bacterium B1(2017)]|nr:MAG: MFS transporter [Bacteroidetes bacterium B1(2017)]